MVVTCLLGMHRLVGPVFKRNPALSLSANGDLCLSYQTCRAALGGGANAPVLTRTGSLKRVLKETE